MSTSTTSRYGEPCSKCGFAHGSSACVTDAEVCAWFDSLSQQYVESFSRHIEDITPRKAWNFFFRPLPVPNTSGESLAALAAGRQGADTLPIEIPRSDTLWRLLTNGYDHSFISSLPDGDRDKESLRLRAAARWLQIRAEISR